MFGMVCAANALFFTPQPAAVQLPSPAELINPLASFINQVRSPLVYQVPFGAVPYSAVRYAAVPYGSLQYGQYPLVAGARLVPLAPITPVVNPIIADSNEA